MKRVIIVGVILLFFWLTALNVQAVITNPGNPGSIACQADNCPGSCPANQCTGNAPSAICECRGKAQCKCLEQCVGEGGGSVCTKYEFSSCEYAWKCSEVSCPDTCPADQCTGPQPGPNCECVSKSVCECLDSWVDPNTGRSYCTKKEVKSCQSEWKCLPPPPPSCDCKGMKIESQLFDGKKLLFSASVEVVDPQSPQPPSITFYVKENGVLIKTSNPVTPFIAKQKTVRGVEVILYRAYFDYDVPVNSSPDDEYEVGFTHVCNPPVVLNFWEKLQTNATQLLNLPNKVMAQLDWGPVLVPIGKTLKLGTFLPTTPNSQPEVPGLRFEPIEECNKVIFRS